ncbi:hypothetical protein [Actinoplanes sp. NPDC048796]|uniref:hypothetical protein n=1 Tax=Actinoplanes sp. NPDC048796 TaxID=3155640 RepID=UPI0033F86D0B
MTIGTSTPDEPEHASHDPSPPMDTNPTQWLCGAVYVDLGLRRFVLNKFLDAGLRTWPPNYGLDTTAVVRHAWRAQRWMRHRDILLGLVVLSALVVLATRWLNRGALVPTCVAVGLIGLLILTRRTLRRRKIRLREAFTWLRKRGRFGRRAAVLAALALMITSVLSGHGLVRALRPGDAVVLEIAVAAVVLIGTVDGFVVLGRARRFLPHLHATTPPAVALRDAAPPLPVRLERRLSALEDGASPAKGSDGPLARVLVYDLPTRRRTFVNNTFVGSGESLGPFEINIDVSKGRRDPDGRRREPLPVNLEELHHAVASAAARQDATGLWCGFRMYVDGASISQELLPTRSGRPVATQELSVVLDRLRQPMVGERTYLCVQLPLANWAYQIMLTLFVRADLTGDHLIVHNDILILPGPMIIGRTWPRIPTDAWTHASGALRLGITRIWGVAAVSPVRVLWDVCGLLRRLWGRLSIQNHGWHRRPLEHGAVYSIREKLAEGAVVVHPDAVQDINTAIAFLMQLLQNGLRDYLESRDIDATRLDDDIKTVVNNQQTKIEELHAKNVTFGDHSQAGDTNQRAGDGNS